MINNYASNSYSGKYLSFYFFLVLFFTVTITQSQNYRNELSYIEDFGKNELFVKEALAEYSKSVMQANSANRNAITLKQLYVKLENINSILSKHDKGYKGDLRLRDALINMNKTTIRLFKNNTLVLNDYDKMKLLPLSDIESIFNQKETDLKDYYFEVLQYEKTKSNFGMNYDVSIRFLDGENLFEYNAYQNLYFYMLNVLDDKLMYLITENKYAEASDCLKVLIKTGQEIVIKNKNTKFDYNNLSLVKANRDLVEFFSNQEKSLFPHFEIFMKANDEFQEFKKLATNNPFIVSDEEYNENVRYYNDTKNNFYKIFQFVQLKKNDMLNNWYAKNSNLLMKSTKFENNYARYAEAD